ncbi:SusC/RagA family TonB-linked outer membrane protein [Leeuwenhoekiella parthenopeia]|uniref:SusC/RagA family TonB-linked outer membrane protein n=1 Tax=Leeuwenhoekiella parthenopeia TaxID=2890320 RepID=A0ABS8GS96_9FLAO|nr:SusC/RagA family TonB-linked outer membrane protein [Leeuwenhoekiella parthenopeia]MCC4212850.1 SusC/RagA family TonB-linked outer membrane protein [Leeuwenhoekiella parthenopeia]
MKSKITWCFALVFLLMMQFAFAQQKTITGTIVDSEGLALPGVNVLVEGTSTGTQTDFDGNYSISANVGDNLIFSYVGFQRQAITIGAADSYNVTMQAGESLDEVVVVGYGTSTKQAFTGSASTIEAKNIELKNFSNVSQALAGEAAGVQVINTSGQPGTVSTIRIRGFGSINGNRDPLYVVDGVPFTGGLNSINPSDIASTTILKDATATAIYGSRGANGVVLITTKSGTSTETYIEVDVKTGVNASIIPRYSVITSPEESIGLMWEAKVNRQVLNGSTRAEAINFVNTNLFGGGTAGNQILAPGYNMWNVADGGELIDPATAMVRPGVTRRYTPERYEDAAFDSAIRTEANLRMGGGTDKSRYYFSVGYLDDDGYAINTGYKRYTTRLNVSSQIKPWANIGANIGYAYSETIANGQTDGAENLFEFADKIPPIYPVFLRDDNYQLVPDPIFGGFQYDYGSESGFRPRPNADNLNPIASAKYDYNGAIRNEINANVNATIDILEGLTFETRFGLQYFNNIDDELGNQFYGVASGSGGTLDQDVTERTVTNFLQLLRYKRNFGLHSFEAFAAHESNEYRQNVTSTFKTKAIIPGGRELSNYIVFPTAPTGTEAGNTLESYFGQINYDFDNKYFITGSLRRDGSSRFYRDKWDTFGSVGAAWVVSNENFLNSNDLIRFLKLKASYGLTGDQGGVGFFSGINLFGVTNVNGGFAVAPDTFANADLTWETAKQYQAGLELDLGSWLDLSVDYFVKDTENLIFERRIAPSTGIAIIDVNDGVLRNSGLEFDLTGHLVKTANYSLDLSINGSLPNNEITTMPLDNQTQEPAVFQNVGAYGYANGRSIYDFYMRDYAGVDPADGYPMWYQYFNDANNNGAFDDGEDPIASLTPFLDENPDATVARQTTKAYADATQLFIEKKGIPVVYGAFRLSAQAYNFSLSTQFTYSLGGYAYDSQYAELMHDNNGGIIGTNRHTDVRNRWRQPGDITSVPLIADNVIPNVNSQSSRFITSTDFIALNNVLLSYAFNNKSLSSMGLSGLSLFASGDNLMYKTARQGFLPTTSQSGNSGRALYAPLTTFTVGVRAKF